VAVLQRLDSGGRCLRWCDVSRLYRGGQGQREVMGLARTSTVDGDSVLGALTPFLPHMFAATRGVVART